MTSRKYLFVFFLFVILLSGCKNKKIKKDIILDYRLENLSYRILEGFEKQDTNDDMIQEFTHDDVTLTMAIVKNVEESLEDFCNGYDRWSINLNNFEEISINGYIWYKDNKRNVSLITKNGKNIFYVNILDLNNDSELAVDLLDILEKSMRFS